MKCPKCGKGNVKYIVPNDTNKKSKKEREDFSTKCKCGWEGTI